MGSWRDASSRALLGIINVIFAVPRRTGSHPSRVISVARPPSENSNPKPKRTRMEIQPVFSFSDEDKVGTTQPYDDALMVTLKIEGMM